MRSTSYIIQQSLNEKSVTLRYKNSALKQILNDISKQTNLQFAIRDEIVGDNLNNITINISNKTVKETLEQLLKDSDYKYEIDNSTIFITKETASKTAQIKETKSVKGRVLDEKKQPLAGVTVINISTNKGAITDTEGYFILEVKKGDKIEFSYMGMKTLTKTINSINESITEILEADELKVEDVVVTGIFKKSRESYTGAVTTIKGNELKVYKGQNILQTLANIDPALNIKSDNNVGSDPNSIPSINIRGEASLPLTVSDLNTKKAEMLNMPLVIMDGFEVSIEHLMNYNDEQVESISIMKDASSTAIYGSRGANGVIVVTTKAPKEGKLTLKVNAAISFEMPDMSSYNLMNAEEKLKLEFDNNLNLVRQNVSNGTYYFIESIQKEYYDLQKEVLRGVNTDWLGQPLRTGIGQRYNIFLEGGSREFKWSVSSDYNQINGAMKGSSRTIFSGTITLSYSVKNLLFRNQSSFSNTKGEDSPYGKFYQYCEMNPYWRLRDDEGNYIKDYKHPRNNYSVGNPLLNADIGIIDENVSSSLINNFSVDWTILDGLVLRGRLGVNKIFNTSDLFYPSNHTMFVNYDKRGMSGEKGKYSYSSGQGMNIDASATLSYSKVFAKKHSLYFGADYSIRENNDYSYYFTVKGFSGKNNTFFANGNEYSDKKPIGNESLTRSIGLTANINYTFDNRLFADFSYRLDGASQYGANNLYAPFWSAGLGWNIHNEKFMKAIPQVNQLRLRASIGDSGSQNFSAYQALTTFETIAGSTYKMWSGVNLLGIGNENLKWQTTRQNNIGLEIGVLNNRITGGIDIYNKKTFDLLSSLDLTPSHGYNHYTENIGEVKNSGYEASLSGYIIRNTKSKFYITLNARLAYNKSVITNLSDAIKKQTELSLSSNLDISNLLYEGRSQNSIYAVKSIGIDPSYGNELFLDKNGKLVDTWNPNNKVYIGEGTPKYRGNIGARLSYKNLSLNLSFAYHWGGVQYNQTLVDRVEVTKDKLYRNLDKRVLYERWSKPGDVKFFKKIDETPTRITSRFVMNDNMISLQSANLNYRIDSEKLLKMTRIQAIDISLNMSDVFYLSSIKRERGISYPFTRRTNISLSLVF